MKLVVDLRLMVITDRELAAPRSIEWVVEEVLRAGAPAIQLRDKTASSQELLQQAMQLRDLTTRYNARLFINDRLDVALAARADGVHLGPADLPLAAARPVAGSLQLGYSADDPALARQAEAEGAAYIGCGAVFATASKAEAKNEQIGSAGVRRVVRAVHVPVIAIGGITPENVQLLADTGAAGCAVIRSVMAAQHPGRVAQQLLRVFV